MSSISGTRNQCPLCGGIDSKLEDTIRYSDIWRELKYKWGAEFSQTVIDMHSPAECVDLKSCSHCNLQYYHPAVPGDAAFYSELTSTSEAYYNDEKWEFQFARRMLGAKDTVLDVACGSGAFIRSIQDVVGAAIGIDTNPCAIGDASSRGISVCESSIDDYSKQWPEGFSVVTAFQVLEHLDSIVPFVEAAYTCVKPGGNLVLSVPNRWRRTRRGFEPLDHPPHHLSRWEDHQFLVLADILQAQVVKLVKQPMTDSEIIVALREEELPSIVPSGFFVGDFLIKSVSRALLTWPLSHFFRGENIKEKLGLYGMSLVVVLRKPS